MQFFLYLFDILFTFFKYFSPKIMIEKENIPLNEMLKMSEVKNVYS